MSKAFWLGAGQITLYIGLTFTVPASARAQTTQGSSLPYILGFNLGLSNSEVETAKKN